MSRFSAAGFGIVLLAALLAPLAGLPQQERCASSMAEAGLLLGRLTLPRFFRETTMHDNKPLTLSLDERSGVLHMEFVKRGEGLWAAGPARVCRRAGTLGVHLSGPDLAIGPGANWLVRQFLRRDASFAISMLAEGRMRVSAAGWSGDFEPVAAP